ncbi:MAG: baseplate J/gp47 family protein [Pseudomonadales bacterium]|nr:baseplate J/gp47 family protein [Pseudomonadales bacterium]
MPLTNQGYTAPDTLELVESMSVSSRAAYGPLIEVSADSTLGIFNGVQAIEISNLFNDLSEIYANLNPNNSEGRMLENICLFGGIVKKGLTQSTGVVTFTGDTGTVIPIGTVVYVSGDSSRRFTTNKEVTIDSLGTARVNVTSEAFDSVAAPAGTLTELETAITGVVSLSNEFDISLGTSTVESDPVLRARRNNTLSVGGNGTPAALKAALEQINGVTTVRIISNNTSKFQEKGTTGNFRPPNSFEAVVENGADGDIIEVLAIVASGTSEMFGDLTAFYTDLTGNNHLVRFSRPSEILIYAEVYYTLYDEEVFPEDGEARIAQELSDWSVTEYQLGVDVLPDRLYVPLFNVPGISGATILVGSTVDTVTDSDIAIQLFEKAVLNSENISVSLQT